MSDNSLRDDPRSGFTWWPADWLADEGVKSVSYAAKGLWIGMICLMFRSPRKGMLLKQTGESVDSHYLANQLGGRAEDVDVLIAELEREQVFSRHNGEIVCRKMWRPTELSEKRAEAGRLGGLAKVKQAELKQTEAKPSNGGKGEEGNRRVRVVVRYSDDFRAFWKAYPRRVGKGAAFGVWQRTQDRPDLAVILAAVKAQSKSVQWMKDGGQYVPHPRTWLNQRRWEDDVEPSKPKDSIRKKEGAPDRDIHGNQPYKQGRKVSL